MSLFESSSERRTARLAKRARRAAARESARPPLDTSLSSLFGIAESRPGAGLSERFSGLLGGLVAPEAPSLLNPARLLEKALIPAFTVLASIFLFIGLWRFAEVTLGPVHTPFLFAILMGLAAVATHLWQRYRKQQEQKLPKPVLRPQMLLSLAQLWLAPKGMRRTMLAGMALNWINRRVIR